MTRLRIIVLLGALFALTTAFAACGSSSSKEDPKQVLDQTFTAGNTIDSGNLNLDLSVNIEGGSNAGKIDFNLAGPFQSNGAKKLPAFALTAKASGDAAGQSLNFDGGLTVTGDAAYVSYNGTNYSVDKAIFDQFKTAYEQSATTSAAQSQNKAQAAAILKALGISKPEDILTNLTNEGDADVEGTSTVHISGDLDVNKAVDAIQKAATLAGASSQVPSAVIDQLKSAITTAHFDIYSGKDDHLLRRLEIQLAIEPPQGAVSKASIDLNISLGDVNKPQTITAPSNPKPLSDLLKQYGIDPAQLGALGALGAGSTGTGSSATPNLQCLQNAKTQADLQQCVTG